MKRDGHRAKLGILTNVDLGGAIDVDESHSYRSADSNQTESRIQRCRANLFGLAISPRNVAHQFWLKFKNIFKDCGKTWYPGGLLRDPPRTLIGICSSG